MHKHQLHNELKQTKKQKKMVQSGSSYVFAQNPSVVNCRCPHASAVNCRSPPCQCL